MSAQLVATIGTAMGGRPQFETQRGMAVGDGDVTVMAVSPSPPCSASSQSAERRPPPLQHLRCLCAGSAGVHLAGAPPPPSAGAWRTPSEGRWGGGRIPGRLRLHNGGRRGGLAADAAGAMEGAVAFVKFGMSTTAAALGMGAGRGAPGAGLRGSLGDGHACQGAGGGGRCVADGGHRGRVCVGVPAVGMAGAPAAVISVAAMPPPLLLYRGSSPCLPKTAARSPRAGRHRQHSCGAC